MYKTRTTSWWGCPHYFVCIELLGCYTLFSLQNTRDMWNIVVDLRANSENSKVNYNHQLIESKSFCSLMISYKCNINFVGSLKSHRQLEDIIWNEIWSDYHSTWFIWFQWFQTRIEFRNSQVILSVLHIMLIIFTA